MSSRVIRSGEGKAISAVSWNPGHRTAERRSSEVPMNGDQRSEFEARVQAAYQQGYAAGQAAGIQQASERIEPAAAALNRIMAELASTRKRFRAEVEEDTVKL